jgi:hypothetical protein
LRLVRDKDLSVNKLIPELEPELERLNQELQWIYEFWLQETFTQETNLYLGNNIVINLEEPLHEILYQVYSHTLDRVCPLLKPLK